MSRVPPVVVIGMHRSGTGLIARVLDRLGVFLGKNRDVNGEAIFFRRLNIWLLHQSGADWDHPEPFRDLLSNADVRRLAVDYLRFVTENPRAVSFLGWGRYLRYRGLSRVPGRWGWKDPRNTYTLPVWLELFPEAKVIHVIRNGVDVAASLKARYDRGLSRRAPKFDRRKALYAVWPKRTGFTGSLRVASLKGGFSLWEEYVQQARSHVAELGPRAMDVRFEDFLAAPKALLEPMAEFCEMPLPPEAIHDISMQMMGERAYAFRQVPELEAFAERMKDNLKLYGY